MNPLAAVPTHVCRGLRRSLLVAVAALLAACGTPVAVRHAPPPPPPPAPASAPAPVVVVPPVEPVAVVAVAPWRTGSATTATTAREYRRYGATHIYAQNSHRVYKGKLPPMLYAVGVLNVDIDAAGQVQRLDWMRAPRHAPEVMAEIERMVRAAAPFPAPTRMGRVTWTDTWLWDKSGFFQIDTLTEGQLGRLAETRRSKK